MRFRAEIQLGGKTATGIPVPEDVVESLGTSKRLAVRVTVNGHNYRSTVARMGGRYMLPVSAENREHAGVAAGDEVDVEIELDTAPRELAVPPDLAEALEGDAVAKRRDVVHDPDPPLEALWLLVSAPGTTDVPMLDGRPRAHPQRVGAHPRRLAPQRPPNRVAGVSHRTTQRSTDHRPPAPGRARRGRRRTGRIMKLALDGEEAADVGHLG